MHSKKMGLIAVLFAIVLVTPIFATVMADVYIPSGTPVANMSEFISNTLNVYDMNASMASVGFGYSDGPMYNMSSGQTFAQIPMATPLANSETSIPWGTAVLILGFVPNVGVSFDQTPPNVELRLTWNGVPDIITLALPQNGSRAVGTAYPPKVYPDLYRPYEFAYPASGPNSDKKAFYNIYDGPFYQIKTRLFGNAATPYGLGQTGLWFWYIFTPNVGDYISYNCQGKVMAPPTYDVTALLEYGTSQIWFNHIAWNVRFLEIHKTVSYEASTGIVPAPYIDGQYWADPVYNPLTEGASAIANDQIVICNVGLRTATGINVTQTFPYTGKYGVMPELETFDAIITGKNGAVVQPWTPVSFPFPGANPTWSTLPKAYTTLAPGQNLTISGLVDVEDYPYVNSAGGFQTFWNGTIVFDSMLQANEIPAWKDPMGMFAIIVGDYTKISGNTYLFTGNEFYFSGGIWHFGQYNEWSVPGPIFRNQLFEAPFVMTLDPLPVPLLGTSKITAADVSMVRQAIVGLAPYDGRMDLAGKGFVSLQDLAEYKAVAGV